MGKRKVKSSKKLKKLTRKLDKLERDVYDNNKFVSRADFLKEKMTDEFREYYNRLSPERQERLIKYILDQEDWEAQSHMTSDKLPKSREESVEKLTSRPAKSMAGLVSDIKKTRKRKKKQHKRLMKTKRGMLTILNPEAYDQTLLSDKDYRKYLKELAGQDKYAPMAPLDCTLKNFKKELLGSKHVNSVVVDNFWNKHGY